MAQGVRRRRLVGEARAGKRALERALEALVERVVAAPLAAALLATAGSAFSGNIDKQLQTAAAATV